MARPKIETPRFPLPATVTTSRPKKVTAANHPLHDLKKYRMESGGLTQMDFWPFFGTTQSGGSRYESGRGVPKPLAMLIDLYVTGQITPEQMEAARRRVEAVGNLE